MIAARFLTVPTLMREDAVPTAAMHPTVEEKQAALRKQIVGARAEVAEAQAAVDHCPSTENREYLELTWLRLDKLLDQLPREVVT